MTTPPNDRTSPEELKRLATEVEHVVMEQGSLAKQQVLSLLALDEETYTLLRDLLSRRGKVESGPPKTGGFRALQQRGPLPEEKSDGLLREQWEEQVVSRLTELFQHKDLEELLGDLAYTVRQSRVARGQDDRRGTKAELATGLVIQHSIDLLANVEIRKAIAKACDLTAPGRWHPGKSGALDFVEAVGLPTVLAGLPSDEAPPAFEYLEGRVLLPPLEDFQDELRQALTHGITTRGHRSILTLPTGAGKTRVAVQGIRDWLYSLWDPQLLVTRGAAVLWLAHTEELCEQACVCFRQVWQGSDSVAPLLMVRFWAGHMQDLGTNRDTLKRMLETPSVIVSTPQRIVNLLDREDDNARQFVDNLKGCLGLTVVDEAHRAAAPSYRRILRDLPDEVPVVGLTATPFRMEYHDDDPEAGTRELKEVFRNLIEPTRTLGEFPRVVLQHRGILARPDFQTIETNIQIRMPEVEDEDDPTEESLESIDRSLAVGADRNQRRLVVLERLIPLAQDPRNLILYFGPSVRDAECMAYLLRERGVPAAVVSGTTREATRRRLIERFRRAELRVLCNCEVLATGFDAPRVTHVIMARPTVSQVLYEQMIGRGLRGKRFGGTEVCVILDCVDEMRGPVRPELGYKRFQKVWKRETRRGGGKAAREPASSPTA
jgi:superfamily II DNA or RNA helicase